MLPYPHYAQTCQIPTLRGGMILAVWQTPEWDAIIVENIQRIRSERSLKIGDVAWGLYQATGEEWDDNRAYRLLSGDRGRRFKWAEVVALAEALSTTIFDLVLPTNETGADFNKLSRAFGMHPVELVASQRDSTKRETRMRHNTMWALQYHPRVKTILDQGKAEAQSLVEQGELGADDVIERTRELAGAETLLMIHRAFKNRYSSDTLLDKSYLEVDEGGAPGYHGEKTALIILTELGMLDKTNEG
jgi:hypothetical protein